MKDRILLGLGRTMIPIPAFIWTRLVAGQTKMNLDFMSTDHHRVRDYVVSTIPHSQGSITPETIAVDLCLLREQVIGILDDLERRMTFLYRGSGPAVIWAYPVTADKTPHLVEFDTGEQVHAA